MTKATTDPQLLEILVDPLSKVPLSYSGKQQELICESGKRAYPIHDGIPIMLLTQARHLAD